MRLRISKREIEYLKNTILGFDSDADIYLFGSRVDRHAKGGDIDILIFSKKIDRGIKRKIRVAFYREFGEQKLDIVVERDRYSLSPFVKTILPKAVKLG
ncbi:MAG TPA: nucleotidyltransferase domain-containing protein [Campylobacterales bacterium]|nr:nucleotidyltransferase domain-containing protein [Campylobacterales bacterium]